MKWKTQLHSKSGVSDITIELGHAYMDPDDFEKVLLLEKNYSTGHRKAKCSVCHRCTPTHCVCLVGVDYRLQANAKKRRNGALAIAAPALRNDAISSNVNTKSHLNSAL